MVCFNFKETYCIHEIVISNNETKYYILWKITAKIDSLLGKSLADVQTWQTEFNTRSSRKASIRWRSYLFVVIVM